MDALLIAVTVVSLSMALAFGALTWRLMRDERRRAGARVAALAAEAAIPPAATPDPPAAAIAEARAPAVPEVPGAALFAGLQAGPAAVARPGLVFATAFGMIALAGLAIATLGSNRAPDATAAIEAPAPLELVSLRHDREGDTLTIRGLVRNPSHGSEARRMSAVAFVFDGEGGFLGSGRTALELPVLAPDTESPFLVTVETPAAPARYRVSFRTENGILVPHVDRRSRAASGGPGDGL